MPWRSWLLIACYSVHYFHRALLSPLYLAPKRAPLHLVVVIAGFIFNGLNGSLLAYQFAQLEPRTGILYWVGIVVWALGFYGNGECPAALAEPEADDSIPRRAAS